MEYLIIKIILMGHTDLESRMEIDYEYSTH